MKAALSRALIALACRCLGEGRRDWAAAMRAEFDSVTAEGRCLPFAAGCLLAALRDLLRREEGRFVLTSYALALGLMVPMASVQIGCALLGFPYLYPGREGLSGAILVGAEHETLMRTFYQSAVPVLAFLLLALGVAHLCIAWAMLERDWDRVRRFGALALALAVTLILFMAVLYLDSSQALLQVAVLAIELATVWMLVRWHTQLFPAPVAEHPG